MNTESETEILRLQARETLRTASKPLKTRDEEGFSPTGHKGNTGPVDKLILNFSLQRQ